MNDDFDALLAAPTLVHGALSADELGKLLGISGRKVRDLATQGVAVKARKGLYEVDETVRNYCGHLREQAAGRSDSTSLTAERIRVAQAQAEKLEIGNARVRGEMVPARDVQTTWAGVLRDVRAAMLAVASRCGANLPHLTGHDVATIDVEIRSALEALADGA